MKNASAFRSLRARFVGFAGAMAAVGFAALGPAAVWAQTGEATSRTPGGVKLEAAPAGAPPAGTASTGSERAIERIRTEDAGSRIDELRVGGETQQITVQPKLPVPSYEIKPAEGARGNAPATGSNDTNGSRVWNIFKF